MTRTALTAAALLTFAGTAAAQVPPAPPAPVTIRDQTDGVNSLRVVTVAAFCRGPAACAGTAKLAKGGQTIAAGAFTAAGKTTFKTPLKLKASVFRTLRKTKHKTIRPRLTLTMADGRAVSHVITVKI
jgi:hypothetical protein